MSSVTFGSVRTCESRLWNGPGKLTPFCGLDHLCRRNRLFKIDPAKVILYDDIHGSDFAHSSLRNENRTAEIGSMNIVTLNDIHEDVFE